MVFFFPWINQLLFSFGTRKKSSYFGKFFLLFQTSVKGLYCKPTVQKAPLFRGFEMKKTDQKQTKPLETPLGFLDHYKANDEMYHYLFPIALGGRYRLQMTHLKTFQLRGIGPEIIPSGTSMNPAYDSIEETFQDRVQMNEAARIFCRTPYGAPLPEGEAEVLARASAMAQGLFKSIQRSKFFPYSFKQMGLEAMSMEEVGQKFATTLAGRDIDGYVEEDLILADISAYLKPGSSQWFKDGGYFFWTEHLLDVFVDFGIIKVDSSFRYMVMLQFINNY